MKTNTYISAVYNYGIYHSMQNRQNFSNLFYFCTDYKNCMSLDEVEEISDDLPDKMLKRLQTNYKMPLMCLASDVLQYPKSILDWLAELW